MNIVRQTIIIGIVAIFIGGSIIPSLQGTGCHNGDHESAHNTTQTKKWTFMFYDDADFQGYDPLTDSYGGISFAEAAYSGETVDVIVLQDTDAGPATLWYIDEHHQLENLEDMGEVNMGDAATLQHLVDYGKNKFPADRYVLALYNHGGCLLYTSDAADD